MAKEMTKEQEERLKQLNKKCIECVQMAQNNFIDMDRKRCLTCEIGFEVHQLDPDNVDGHNSGRYERYFTA